MNPKQNLETAAKAYLVGVETPLTLIASTSIYKGTQNRIGVEDEENTTEVQNKVHPSVTLEADGGHGEVVFKTRVFQGSLNVTVEASSKRNTETQFQAICDEVFAKFNIVELEANFSSRTASFTMIEARIIEISDSYNNGTNWQRTLRLNCVYAPADL